MPSQWQLTTTTTTFLCLCLLSAATYAYLKHKHSSLEARIHRHPVPPHQSSQNHSSGSLQLLPPTLLQNSSALIHEQCSLPLPTYHHSKAHSPQHFTLLLRHNMTRFASYLQAWLFWLAQPERRSTFQRSYIESLDFVEGDLVCGVYRVVLRADTRVELSMEAPPSLGLGDVQGLLVLRLQPSSETSGMGAGEGVVLVTETLQWSTSEEGTMGELPLAKPLPRFLHEIASAALLVSGADFLRRLA